MQVSKQIFSRLKKRFRNLKWRGRLPGVSEKPLAFMDIEKLESEISNKIISIKKIINETDPLLNIILIELYRTIKHLGNPEVSINGNVSPGLNKIQDFIQSILVTSSNDKNHERFINDKKSRKLIKDIEELYILNAVYINVVEKDELIKYSQGMTTNVSGKLYPYFEEEHFTSLITPYSKICKDEFGLTSEDIVSGLQKISMQLRTSGLMQIIPNIETAIKFADKEKIIDFAEFFNVQVITNWPAEFINHFSLSIGELPDYYQYDIEVMNKELPQKYKPFLKYNNKFYCTSIDNLLDNFYRTFVKVLRKANPNLSLEINEIQKSLSEELPFELLEKLLPKAKVYKNIYYKAPVGANGRNEWCECDGVIIYDDVMIIVEVKAGAISPASPFSDEESFKSSLKELTENPYNQTIRFYEEYKRNNKIEIYHKESKKKYQFIAELKEANFVQACCVTLDDLNELAAQIEKTDLIQNSSLPVWCISVGDLRVYAEILDSPSHFLNFLYQRSKASCNEYIKLDDELDHLGMYLAYNDYSNYVEELLEEFDGNNGLASIHFASHRDEINEYMAYKHMKKLGLDENDFILYDMKKEKPKQSMESEFEKLIRLLDESNNVLDIKLARYLLLLDSYTRGHIADFLRTRTRRLVESRYRKMFYNPYAAYNYEREHKIDEIPVIMIFIMEASSKLFKDIILRRRFLMERVTNHEEDTLCILVGIERKGDIKKLLTNLVDVNLFKKLDVSSFELLMQTRENIRKSRYSIKNPSI